VARLGGDEFVVMQLGVENASEAELLARRIVKRLAVPYDVDGGTVKISASIGVALNTDLPSDLDLLLSCADRALYRSKAAGKNRVDFCDEDDAFEVLRAA
jgi:diguanylate cyclase